MQKSSSNMKKIATKILLTVLFSIFCFVWIFPLIWILNGAFKGTLDWATNPKSFFPDSGYTIENFQVLFGQITQGPSWDFSLEPQPIARWVFNSLFASTVHTILYLIIASLGAFAFTFLEFKFKKILFAFFLSAMVVPGIVLTTPQFENIINLNLSLNIWAIILPTLGNISGVFLMMQFFKGIPKDIVESAKVDGAGLFRIYLTQILPLAKSVLFVQGLFSFMSIWNDYAWAQIVLGYGDKTIRTLQLGLTYMVDINKGQLGATGITLAASLISMLPIFIIYLFTQRKIIEGVAMTGLKN